MVNSFLTIILSTLVITLDVVVVCVLIMMERHRRQWKALLEQERNEWMTLLETERERAVSTVRKRRG